MNKLKQIHMRRFRFTRNSLVSLTGIAGYVLLLTAWVLCLAMLVNLALTYGDRSVVVVQDAVGATQTSVDEQSVATQIIAYVITAIIVIVTLVLIAVLPYYIAKYSSRGVKRLIKLFKVDETLKQLFTFKLLLSFVPLAIFMVVFMVNPYITVTDIALYAATIVVVVVSMVSFLVQTIIAKRFKRTYDQIS